MLPGFIQSVEELKRKTEVPEKRTKFAFRLTSVSRLQQQLLLGFPACQDFRLAISYNHMRASQVAPVVKNPPANAGDARDAGLIPGSRRSPEGGHGNHSSILAWEIPRTEEPGGLQSIESERVRHD